MATPEEPAEKTPRYPSYEVLLATQQWVRPSRDSGQLLFWTLDGPLTSAISVMPSPSTPEGPLEPYYDQARATWHPIAHLPITEPKVSSISVRVYQLDEWITVWCEEHEHHSDLDDAADIGDDEVEWTTVTTEDETPQRELIKCCGTYRPGSNSSFGIVVKPSNMAQDAGFVTVHDVLETVHPWLMELKWEIGTAMAILDGAGDEPVGLDGGFVVNSNAFESLVIERKEEWMALKRGAKGPREVHISAS
ncbi:hypothetical protein Tdes44962_MAKER06453 [Teratosphaeria destructans]|uniref:Protein HRI1 n=1 Tax=Teratosphaeria destructans TaxID=418781 RepID=A0A9W7T1X0_9PEZI|nr:hypothetical protein Tdes44962_MAKER06453 [Teratosphaeria destructans]